MTQNQSSQTKILKSHRSDILKAYAAKAWFNGKHMSMGKRGQMKCYNKIAKQLDSSNIDCVAETMSSNGCENFFGMMAKFSHGNRIFLGQTNSWEIYQLLVAGKKSFDNFEDMLREYDNIVSLYVRDVRVVNAVKAKENQRERQRGVKHINCRKVRSYAKLKDAVKNKTAAVGHLPNKLSPKDACKAKAKASKVPAKPTRKRKSCCKNCGLAHDGPCVKPQYPDVQKKQKGSKKNKADEMEDPEEMYGVLFGGGD